MNYKVTLQQKETHVDDTVVVDRIEYKDIGEGYWVKLVGTDPYCYPDFVQEVNLRWFSKDLTLMLHVDDPIDVVAVATTDESVPDPEVNL